MSLDLAGPDAAMTMCNVVPESALAQLPPDQARAVVLAVIAGLTAVEVAEHEGIPLGTAKTRIRTGLRRLRVAMEADHE